MSFKSRVKRINDHVIQFLSDTDFYKFTMLQFILHRFPWAVGKYRFKNRTKGVTDLAKFEREINEEIDWLCTLRFHDFELLHLAKKEYLREDFIHFLRLFQLNRQWIKVWVEDGELKIEAEGPLLHVMMFEIYVLAIVEEVYTRNTYSDISFNEGRSRLNKKIETILDYTKYGKPFKMSEFGGRRRWSGIWHEEVVSTLKDALPTDIFVGTSNVLFANLYEIIDMGTMAHEIFQAAQALGPRPINCQRFILDEWAKEYRGDLGYALTDTLGTDKFFHDFDKFFAKLYDGGRHDSGDPFKWGDRMIDHYTKLKINPLTKYGLFSDGLDIPKTIELCKYFDGRLPVSFGIGTNLTNDLGFPSLQLVMKIVECNGKPVAKISDNPEKAMCGDNEYVKNLVREIQEELKENHKPFYTSIIA